ncbi:MAG: GNAT family N-acetyltransferase, partial [Geodermatophilaceae bacterium]|nr:GNAT family N-acetyltransferase [Geodermatophilaceae bacterium]
YLDHQRRHGFAPFAVVRDGRLIGDMGCQYLEDGTDVELLYRLLPDTWGMGLATEAGDAALAHAFSTRGCVEVVAVIAEDNQPSRRLAQRLGFTPGNVGTYYGQRLQRHSVTPEQHAHAVAQRLTEARTAGPELVR